jgi:hypothetical protein
MPDANEINFEEFQNPPAQFRSIPFWSLNDRLEPAEIKKQLQQFAEGGFGGAYLHSRTGLMTEYLGEAWWNAIQAACEQCEELGIEAWFYDEEKWPSGFAGGIVPNLSSDYHARSLIRLVKGTVLPPNCEWLQEDDSYIYVSCKDALGNAWYNGTCWVDLMNPEMVKSFIDCSYAPYTQKYSTFLGHTAKGIFTDEPQISPRAVNFPHQGMISYSPWLRGFFHHQHGYDMLEDLQALFDNTGAYRKVRLDYYRSLSALLESSFSRQIGEYCAEAGLTWTGHFNGENSFGSIILNVGNMMIQYRHMQQPGIDHLGLRIDGGLIAAKSLTSVANQYGMTRRLSELFGISGQNMSFEDRKWIAGWHAVLGINHFCPHLALYSMKGCRKRDYPPTISPQQPYWKDNKLVEDYMARICYVTAQGEFAPELLVLHPLESCIIELPGVDVVSINAVSTNSINERDTQFITLLEQLMGIHRDYDLGDEQILQDIGKIDGDQLQVGQMHYKIVLLPYMSTIRPSTLTLLEAFMQNGGKVLTVGGYPNYVDGVEDRVALDKLKSYAIPIQEDQLASALAQAVAPAIRLFGEEVSSIWSQHRTLEGGSLVYFTNLSRNKEIACAFMLQETVESALLWDPETGHAYHLKADEEGKFHVRLEPAHSFIVTTGEASRGAVIAGDYHLPGKLNPILTLEGPWKGNRQEPNLLTLDYAQYSTNEGETYSELEPVIGIHERFTGIGYNGSLILSYQYEAAIIPSQAFLIVEQPEMYERIAVNGRTLDYQDCESYRDASFRKMDITDSLQLGTNRITLTLNYIAPILDSSQAISRYGKEIESIYIAGDFGVEAECAEVAVPETPPVHWLSNFVMTEERETIEGDLAVAGYPFYAGEYRLSCSFVLPVKKANRRYFLAFPGLNVITLTAELNGQMLGTIASSPWRFEVTDAIQAGENQLQLTLANSLRNMLGPHHHIGGELTKVSPESFTGQTSWTYPGPGEVEWYDCRLNGQAKLWCDDYAIVPFGLSKEPVILVEN